MFFIHYFIILADSFVKEVMNIITIKGRLRLFANPLPVLSSSIRKKIESRIVILRNPEGYEIITSIRPGAGRHPFLIETVTLFCIEIWPLCSQISIQKIKPRP